MDFIKNNSLLEHEENRALRIYLISFYITFFLYEVFYYFIFPKFIYHSEPGYYTYFSFILYLFLLLLIPVSKILIKKNHLSMVKYVYFYTYNILTLILEVLVFIGTDYKFGSGNAAELILLLFAPIFINKRYFWTVSLGMISRYAIAGCILHNSSVTMAIVLTIILTVIGYIILKQITSYINALNKSHEEIRHKDKLAIIGQMASTIGHEIRNPLASLKGFTQLQREKHPEDEPHYSIMEKEIERINSILHDVLLIGKPRSLHFEVKDLNEIIEYVVSVVQENVSYSNIKMKTKLEQNLPKVECEENQMKQVILNLVKNGIESMKSGGELKIQTKRNSHQDVMISIVDQGCGINQDQLKRLGEPFYTTKEDGTGLGLMVSKKIIEDHQGTLHFDSEVNKGTEVSIILPVSQK